MSDVTNEQDEALVRLTEAVLDKNVSPHSLESLCHDIDTSFIYRDLATGKVYRGSKAFAEHFQTIINAAPSAVKARLMELYLKMQLKQLSMQNSEDVSELSDEELRLQAKLLYQEIVGEQVA